MHVCVSFSFSVACSGLQATKRGVKRINNATSLNTEVNLVRVNSVRLTAWRAEG